jgi:secreted trypsin-like serine protease
MLRRKPLPLPMGGGALLLAGVFGVLLVSPALAERSGQTPASPARHSLHPQEGNSSGALGQLAAAAHPGRTTSRPRIVGGYGGLQSDWPFMAFIAYFDASGNPEFACSGTVVSSNVVLTAGHCAVDETSGAPLVPSGFRVVTGSVDWTDTSQRQLSQVSKVIVNPADDPAVADTTDAALLVLSTPTTAPAIPLATSADQYLDLGGTGALIAGWGAPYGGGPAPLADLQWAATVVQSPGYCSQFDPYFDSFSELCAVNPPDFTTGACNGDSGGPLATDDASGTLVEIGVITHGPADCNTYTANYFTNAIPLSPWVSGWTRAVAPPPPPPPSPPPTTTSAASPSPPTSTSPLSTMTLGQAKQYVRQTVVGALGQRAKPAHSYTAKCSRRSATRFTCAVQFWHSANDYYGNVTVYLDSGPNGLSEWTDTYTLHWVNTQCYLHSGHPQRCAVHTRHGTW